MLVASLDLLHRGSPAHEGSTQSERWVQVHQEVHVRHATVPATLDLQAEEHVLKVERLKTEFFDPVESELDQDVVAEDIVAIGADVAGHLPRMHLHLQ